MANGNSLTFVTNSSGTFVQPNDGSAAAKVLQMDLSVDGGGVVHVSICWVSSQDVELD